MQFLSVKNWDEFQHYKSGKRADGVPPWIKLHLSLQQDYEFSQLPDVAKAHLIGIWMLAPCYQNAIPHDANFIANRINATEPIQLDALIDSGFLRVLDDDQLKEVQQNQQSKDSRYQHASKALAQKEKEKEKEKENNSANASASARRSSSKSKPKSPTVTFDGDTGKFVVAPEALAKYEAVYARICISQQIEKAEAWLMSNPERAKKKRWGRFLNSWLATAQKDVEQRQTGAEGAYAPG